VIEKKTEGGDPLIETNTLLSNKSYLKLDSSVIVEILN